MASIPAKLPRKPNLIVFLPDQQRADTLACYGGRSSVAPHLAKLSSQSVVFERAYVTQPVCSPSRSSLLSGTWPHANGVTKNSVSLPGQIGVLPELLRDPDYQTAYFGKWHLGKEAEKQRGFGEWISTEGVSDYSRYLIDRGLPPRPDGSLSTLGVSELPIELSKPAFLEGHAREFIRKQGRTPFILFVAFAEPHSPYNGPLNEANALNQITLDPSATMPEAANVPLRYRLMREWQQTEAELDRQRRSGLFFFGITPEEFRGMKQRYLGLVTMVDRSIGAILDCVEDAGLTDDTIVVHTSDHGDMMGAHHLFAKEVMYEQAIRVPYLVRLPGQRESRLVSQAVSHIDLIPTLLELLGRSPAEQCTGQSRLPLLHGETMPPNNVFLEWSPNRTKFKKGTRLAPRRAIKRAVEESTRTVITPDGWKLSLRNTDACELYSLTEDPQEMRNLYDESNYRPIVARCRDEIHRWQETVHDDLSL